MKLYFLASLYIDIRKNVIDRNKRKREKRIEISNRANEIREEIFRQREIDERERRDRRDIMQAQIDNDIILKRVENFLIFEKKKNKSITDGSVVKETDCLSECVICMENVQVSNVIREITHCKHSFHVKCIDKWFEENNSCPECRFIIYKPIKIEKML